MTPLTDTLLIILVVYKRRLEECEAFQSILKMHKSGQLLNLFVYDNSPEPQRIFNYQGLSIIYKHDSQNSGLSKAYNIGAVQAKNDKLDWILLLDQDTILPANILSKYHFAIHERPNIRLFVPILMLDNKKIFSPCIYRYKRGFHPKEVKKGVDQLDRLAPVNSGMM